MKKALTIVSIILAVSIALNIACAYYFSTLEPESADHSALITEVEKRHDGELAELKKAQNVEIESLKTRLAVEVESKKHEMAALAASLARVRTDVVQRSSESPTALRAAVLEATGMKVTEIEAKNDRIVLTRPGAGGWLDLTLDLQDQVKVCKKECEVDLAKMKADLLPGFTEELQKRDVIILGLQHNAETQRLDNEYLTRKLASTRADILKWSLISASAGIAVGAVGSAVGTWYVMR